MIIKKATIRIKNLHSFLIKRVTAVLGSYIQSIRLCTDLILCFADCLGVSADVVKSSYEAYQSWMNNHKKEEIDQ